MKICILACSLPAIVISTVETPDRVCLWIIIIIIISCFPEHIFILGTNVGKKKKRKKRIFELIWTELRW